jgi:diguanylate cyclase (GGDEF)-like protein
MKRWDDYYKILQVHHLAETEVIECVYKILAKKHHPDTKIEKECDLMMKQINAAYDILKDKEKRKKYDIEWLKRQNINTNKKPTVGNAEKDAESIVKAKSVLDRYFSCIRNERFENAYRLISNIDKKNISLDDFLKWQRTVFKIFQLQKFESKEREIYKNFKLNSLIYDQVIDFVVITTAQNSVMNQSEKDIVNKKVVEEPEGWHVYLGYEGIQSHIVRFEELTGLLAAKSVINEMLDIYSSTDNLTGFLNKRGFIETVEKEIMRFKRYGNTFSLMLIDIQITDNSANDIVEELRHYTMEWSSEILKNCFRKLDSVGRWGECDFIILMPETNLSASSKTAKKIKKTFGKNRLSFNEKEYNFNISIGVVEFKETLVETIEKLGSCTGLARENGDNSIATCTGILDN